jgi:hypothetical protein
MPQTEDTMPPVPGIYRCRTPGDFWQRWRGWDGRHFTIGYWTLFGARYECRQWLDAGALMPRKQRHKADAAPVTEWLPDPQTGGRRWRQPSRQAGAGDLQLGPRSGASWLVLRQHRFSHGNFFAWRER